MTSAIVPQNYTFVDRTQPLIDAAWLNPINLFAFQGLNDLLADGNGLDVFSFDPSKAYAGNIRKRLTDVITTSGFANTTAGLQAAVNAAAGKRLIVLGTWNLTSTIVISAACEIVLAPGCVITTTLGDISHFSATGQTGVSIFGPGQITKTGAFGSNAYVAAVKFVNCTDCHVYGVITSGLQWAGVMMDGCARCSVQRCYFGPTTTTVQDSNDVTVYDACVDCRVLSNWCMGNGSEHGVLVQDPYAYNAIPRRNLIMSNRIGQHTGYGIAFYIPGQMAVMSVTWSGTVMTVASFTGGSGNLAVGQNVYNQSSGALLGQIVSLGTGTGGTGTYNMDTSQALGATTVTANDISGSFNQASHNFISDIQGSFSGNRASGAGHYIVGAGVGGSISVNNYIANCCVQTDNTRSLAPGAIGVNGIPAGAPKPYIGGNIVVGGAQGDGILVVSSPGGAEIGPNNVTIPATSNGSGFGGSAMKGTPLRIEASNNVDVIGGDYVANNDQAALLAYANGTNCADLTVTGGKYTSTGTGPALSVSQAGGKIFSNITINGTRFKATNISATCLQVASGAANILLLNGVNASSTGGLTISITACTNVRISGGYYVTTGSNLLATSGTCTGGYAGADVGWGNATSAINNAGTGFNIKWRDTAQPAAGTWAAGDEWVKTNPAANTSAGGFCVTAGSPGTWKATAAIAA